LNIDFQKNALLIKIEKLGKSSLYHVHRWKWSVEDGSGGWKARWRVEVEGGAWKVDGSNSTVHLPPSTLHLLPSTLITIIISQGVQALNT
jgi:hypothetical protein